jgi:hypothetical protein
MNLDLSSYAISVQYEADSMSDRLEHLLQEAQHIETHCDDSELRRAAHFRARVERAFQAVQDIRQNCGEIPESGIPSSFTYRAKETP